MDSLESAHPGVILDRSAEEIEVSEVMRPGVVTVAEDASVLQARRALQAHGVHAVLVVERSHGRPLGFITARGLLGWVDRDETIACARDAVSQAPIWLRPSASLRQALDAIVEPGVTHLLVRRGPDEMGEGVVSALDLLAYGRK
jgi:CBS domain-containing protein